MNRHQLPIVDYLPKLEKSASLGLIELPGRRSAVPGWAVSSVGATIAS